MHVACVLGLADVYGFLFNVYGLVSEWGEGERRRGGIFWVGRTPTKALERGFTRGPGSGSADKDGNLAMEEILGRGAVRTIDPNNGLR